MNKTEYNEIINGTETYKEIANNLKQHIPVIIGWTDEECTHLDILFTYQAHKEKENYLQGGFMPTDLFVSILSWGSYGFEVDREKNVGYISEKLGINGEMAEKLTELINGLINELKGSNKDESI